MSGGIQWLTLPAGYLGSSLIGEVLLRYVWGGDIDGDHRCLSHCLWIWHKCKQGRLSCLSRILPIHIVVGPSWLVVSRHFSQMTSQTHTVAHIEHGYWLLECRVLSYSFGLLPEVSHWDILYVYKSKTWWAIPDLTSDSLCWCHVLSVRIVGRDRRHDCAKSEHFRCKCVRLRVHEHRFLLLTIYFR
jgi:hypothetical protein